MLSIGVLHSSAQAGTYYAQDDYYTKGGAGEPSAWDGQGAVSLGLAGTVDRAQFEALLNGELPNGIVLKRGQEGKHQPGWDPPRGRRRTGSSSTSTPSTNRRWAERASMSQSTGRGAKRSCTWTIGPG
jgi:hypothetical protein